jgi:hypothetical protein
MQAGCTTINERDLLDDSKEEDLPPAPLLFMSGCGCWMLQARLDLYMLGQCRFEDAIYASDLLSATLLSKDPRVPFLLWLVLTARSIGRAGAGELDSEKEGDRVFE